MNSTLLAKSRPKRPQNAATLLIVRWKNQLPFVLMGRRHHQHAFLPGYFVFPGGRVDRADYHVNADAPLHAVDEKRILSELGKAGSANAANAIALAAIRETYEETGLLIGKRLDVMQKPRIHPHWAFLYKHRIIPVLSSLRYFARAITPPRNVRRYDTRFFLTDAANVLNPLDMQPSEELEDLQWVSFQAPEDLSIHPITREIMKIAAQVLQKSPLLHDPVPIEFFHAAHGTQHQDTIDIY